MAASRHRSFDTHTRYQRSSRLNDTRDEWFKASGAVTVPDAQEEEKRCRKRWNMISEAMKSHTSFATPSPTYLQPPPPPPVAYPPAMPFYGMPFSGLPPSQGYYPYHYLQTPGYLPFSQNNPGLSSSIVTPAPVAPGPSTQLLEQITKKLFGDTEKSRRKGIGLS